VEHSSIVLIFYFVTLLCVPCVLCERLFLSLRLGVFARDPFFSHPLSDVYLFPDLRLPTSDLYPFLLPTPFCVCHDDDATRVYERHELSKSRKAGNGI